MEQIRDFLLPLLAAFVRESDLVERTRFGP
jgi:hypothetical protein